MKLYLLKKVDSTVANGEITRFDIIFQKSSTAEASESVCMFANVAYLMLLHHFPTNRRFQVWKQTTLEQFVTHFATMFSTVF